MVTNKDDEEQHTRAPPVHFNVDSGASVHCINDPGLFETVYNDHPPIRITVANKQVLTLVDVEST